MEREEEIRLIAYSLWEQEGRPDGKDVEHYFRAIKILEEREAGGSAFTHETPSVLITPPPTRVELLSSPPKPNTRSRGKKK
jgi:hypothetical protein